MTSVTVSGVWTHAKDDSDVTWFPRIQTCSANHEQYSGGGDILHFYIGCPRLHNGAYCDSFATETHHRFICKGII